jgi:hypothetical protein
LQQSEIDSLKKACLYSFPANRLGYCGPENSWRFFQKFLSRPTEENAAEAKELLRHFNALHPYLELIAKANRLQPLDMQVVEAYWLGNKLLENIQYSEMQKTLLSFQNFGLPRQIAERKAALLPDGMLPHHSMHVLYVNSISKKVKPILKNLSDCLIQWALVKDKTRNGVKVKGIQLFLESKELKIREEEKTVKNPFNLQLQPGDLVSVHWKNAVEKISQGQAKNLKKFTEKTLKAIRHDSQ